MTTRINKSAYEKLIKEDLEWLDRQSRSLEASHIRVVLEWSIGAAYSEAAASEIARLQSELVRALRRTNTWLPDMRAKEMLAKRNDELKSALAAKTELCGRLAAALAAEHYHEDQALSIVPCDEDCEIKQLLDEAGKL